MPYIKGIELASEIYGLEDETARGDTETNASAIGTLANLETTAKDNLVAAINEVNSKTSPTKETFITSKDGITVRGVKKGDFVQLSIDGAYAGEEVRSLQFNDFLPSTWRPSSLVVGLFCNTNNASVGGSFYIASNGKITLDSANKSPFVTGSYFMQSITYML